jgi:excisionase family DNA binding protein
MAGGEELAPRDDAVSKTLEERLTEQFYEWEKRGRGWQLWAYPVELEPAFRPFIFHDVAPSGPVADDARKPTVLSSLVEKIRGLFAPQSVTIQPASFSFAADALEPQPEVFEDESALVEMQVSVPPTLKITRDAAERFLLSLTYSVRPLSFEVVGLPESIIIQVACREQDPAQLRQQLRAYFPEAVLTEKDGVLRQLWDERSGKETVVVDFGLSHEFMRPLRTFERFESDPLIGITGALAELQEGEIGLLQILFQAAHYPWPENIMRAVTDWEGRSFFVDAPEMVSLAKQKVSRPLFAAVIRVAARGASYKRAWEIAKGLGGALTQFSAPPSNELIALSDKGYRKQDHIRDVLSRTSHRSGILLNSEELVSLVHLPSASVRIPKLKREERKTKAAPAVATGHRLVLGENSHAGKTVPVSLSPDQRMRHTYVIGASGTGKSTLLLNLIVQDIRNGEGITVLDPHGDLIDQILGYVPEGRLQDVVLLDPSDADYPVGFNILSAHSELEKNLLASDLVAVFRRLSTSWGDQMNSVLGNAILAFLESGEGGTVADLRRFLVEAEFRRRFLATVRDPEVVYYWQKEFPLLAGRPQAPILTRLDTFLRPRIIRNMVSQKENRLDFRKIMDEGRIFLAKLAQGAIGEENAYLLGTFLVSKMHQTAMSRQEVSESERKNFYLYIDEFQNFVTPSMAAVLSGARKFHLGLVLAHQELRQLSNREPEVASAVLANAATRVTFRVGDEDARKLEDGFSFFVAKDLQNLGIGEAICRIERAEYDFNFRTLPMPKVDAETARRRREEVVRLSREQYGRRRAEVEALLREQTTVDVGAPIGTPSPTAKASPPADRPPRKAEPQAPRWALSAGERAFLEFVGQHPGCFVTRAYAALGLSGYKGDKLKEALIAQDLLVQQETRQGAGGRVAKVLSLTPQGVKQLTTSSADLPGKGGDEHKRLQQMVQEQAELQGWRATVEERIPQTERQVQVDVGLEKDGMAVAVEIGVTTTIDHEIENIRKCLAAGFDYVVFVSSEEATVQAMKAKGRRVFALDERRRIRYSEPGMIRFILLEIFGSGAVVSGKEGASLTRRNQNPLLGVEEAAEFLGLSPATLYSWVSQRRIPFVKVGRLTKFSRRSLETWLEQRAKQERQEGFR